MTAAMRENADPSNLWCATTNGNQPGTSAMHCWNTPRETMIISGRLARRTALTIKRYSLSSELETRLNFEIEVEFHESASRAITTVVQELLPLGRSRFAAIRISSRGRSPRMIGQ